MDADMVWTLVEGVTRALVVWIICLLSRKVWDRVMGDKCIIGGCFRQRAQRGLCLVCYSKAKKKVESGETWERLEQMGLVEREGDPFEAAYDKAVDVTMNKVPNEGNK